MRNRRNGSRRPTTRHLQPGLLQLYQGYRCAQHFSQSVWQFAIDIEDLRHSGFSDADLHELVRGGYLEHRVEITPAQDIKRTFRKASGGRFTIKSCFVLTETGVPLALKWAKAENGIDSPDDTCRPQWDRSHRELRFGGVLVKKLPHDAKNQELLVEAFEEDRWRGRIFDPVPPVAGKNCKQRFHDAVVKLNMHQRHRLLRFRG